MENHTTNLSIGWEPWLVEAEERPCGHSLLLYILDWSICEKSRRISNTNSCHTLGTTGTGERCSSRGDVKLLRELLVSGGVATLEGFKTLALNSLPVLA